MPPAPSDITVCKTVFRKISKLSRNFEFQNNTPSNTFSKTPDDFSSPGSKEATIFGVVHRFLYAQTVWVVVFGDADASCPRARNPASQSTTRLSRRARPVDGGAGSWCDVTTLVEPWEIV
jgi:hypothetical protein